MTEDKLTFKQFVAQAAEALADDIIKQSKEPGAAANPMLSSITKHVRPDGVQTLIIVAIGEASCIKHLEAEYAKIEPPLCWPQLHVQIKDLPVDPS